MSWFSRSALNVKWNVILLPAKQLATANKMIHFFTLRGHIAPDSVKIRTLQATAPMHLPSQLIIDCRLYEWFCVLCWRHDSVLTVSWQ